MLKTIAILTMLIVLLAFTSELTSPPKQTLSSNESSAPKKQNVKLKAPPSAKTLENNYFVIQTFNNCGPASLSMLLSYNGVNIDQAELSKQLRPYQNESGDNDDKSVTIPELAIKAEEYNLISYHRPGGDINLLKQFISYGIPVLTRTWLNLDEDIGHYRIIKGFNDNEKLIIQDDSYQGQNLTFTYEDFQTMWSKYNFEYLVLIPKEKQEIAQAIIGKNIDEEYAWKEALKNSEKALENNPEDVYSRFNLAIASYHLNDYKRTVAEYEKIENQLPFRTLWYQKEPIEAYFRLGEYDRVLSLTNSILNNENRAFSELYILRGKIFQSKGETELAKEEFENAVYYNNQLTEAKIALNLLNQIIKSEI